ncbi:8722_t:CDS:2, partial [Entrophospora sp. SA101]
EDSVDNFENPNYSNNSTKSEDNNTTSDYNNEEKEATESINVPKLIDTVIAGSFIKDDYGKLPNEEISSEPIHEVHFFGIFKELNIVQ